ncbi:hypothetical protein Rt10032_c23g6632 [Rhodotorula toruloides]|uniref:Uncharacterized protein n=1 Tax=Rhodotorula toruloides TaxID=5286 RepID=A0A511KRR1_RHOTO|nr:hypothetical protein Rt10032_c23g6632 [Rhodotorula toruloides]
MSASRTPLAAGDTSPAPSSPSSPPSLPAEHFARSGRRSGGRSGWRLWLVGAPANRRWGEGFVRADGTVDWARLDAATVEEVGPAPNALLVAPETLFLRDSLDAEPAMLPSAPSMTARLGLGSLPSNTLPLVLSVLYIVFRAFGLGLPSHRRTRSAGQNGAGEKVRMAAFERNSRE